MKKDNQYFFIKLTRAILNIFFWIVLVSFLIGGVFGFKFYKQFKMYEDALIKNENIKGFVYQPPETTRIYTSDGVLLATLFNENRTYVTYEQIPKTLKQAFVSIEDENFYKHKGIDIKGIIRAALRNFKTGSMQGGSTITQQFIKNAVLTNEQTFERKIKEMVLAREFETKFNKEDILEMYLNEISFGGQIFGVQSAAKTFFQKDVTALSLSESALLAGMVKAPSRYSPTFNMEKSLERRDVVLNKMLSDGAITENQLILAKQEDIKIAKKEKSSRVTTFKHPYFTTFVVKELEKQYGESIYSNGWDIYTSLDSKHQEVAEKSIKDMVERYGDVYNFNNASLVSVEVKTGQVKAFVGGYDFNIDQNNLAVIPRQPGSSIKPITYATAFEKNVVGITDLIKDEEISFGKWTPKNYTLRYDGYMTIMDAIKKSNNVVAVKVLNEVGVNNVVSKSKKLGISTIVRDDYVLPFTLGGMTYGVSAYEMAGAYSVFPNKGIKAKNDYVLMIADSHNNIVSLYEKNEDRVFKKSVANKMNFILNSNVISGTGRRASIGRPVAGKTGTTSERTSVWFVGYSPYVSTAVWVGNSDNSSMSKGAAGGRLAAPIFADYMKVAVKDYKNKGFDVGFSLQTIKINKEDGLLASKYCPEEFIKTINVLPSDVPSEVSDMHSPTEFKTYYDSKGNSYLVPMDKDGNILEYPIDSEGNRVFVTEDNPINEEVVESEDINNTEEVEIKEEEPISDEVDIEEGESTSDEDANKEESVSDEVGDFEVEDIVDSPVEDNPVDEIPVEEKETINEGFPDNELLSDDV